LYNVQPFLLERQHLSYGFDKHLSMELSSIFHDSQNEIHLGFVESITKADRGLIESVPIVCPFVPIKIRET